MEAGLAGKRRRWKAAKVADARRAVAYVRVSTEDQNLGPDAQRAAVERWAQAMGVKLVAHFAERDVHGDASLDKRLELLKAIDALPRHRAGLLVVAKRDRLARDAMTSAMIERLVERVGARTCSADGAGNGAGPEAVLMRGMMDLFAQYELAVIRARTKAALAVKKARGERVGQVPYGWRVSPNGVTLERHEAEQAAIARAVDLRRRGSTLKHIAEILDLEHPARGRRWHVTRLHTLLVRHEREVDAGRRSKES